MLSWWKAERAVQELEHQRRLLIRQRELAQLLLNLIQLREESRRLQEHRDHFQSLQAQAETVKEELRQTPLITGEHVIALRQAEQRLLQAETRCQAMATGVELLEADQTVWLGDQELNSGQPQPPQPERGDPGGGRGEASHQPRGG